ncbi:TIGR00282 family metallophosphoesterase [Dethiobacter alkaliphilus]|uniref:Metallophosphoesterase n=1 Tax=Dethiobacter alkaliphilus AHT 1 TaxID=555088 RepID=C0GDN1_DETAL|nr:TIGR00282 family metallophosphoesterase [Dethiobacter alkaliphilus]EEG78514.1 metallophosphoesterase [Dethiobacter alkaliphilus AHT 1]MCW3490749.1 TIGR00282 family metallophosphoesterase [Dethiobacter alkaliphilus]
MRILMIGDVVGRPGRHCVRDLLPRVKENYCVDFTVANGENLASGTGFNEKTANELFGYGVDALTMGNHVWDKKEGVAYINRDSRIVRPVNYPPGTPGQGYAVFACKGVKIGIVNANGRVFMPALDCPFRRVEEAVKELQAETNCLLVDFHAEATSEKIAMGRFLDGSVSAVVGTHTHVQTADERLLSNGTAYISDVGMTGPYESVLGIDPEIVIKKFRTQLPARFEVLDKGAAQFNAVVIEIDPQTGYAVSIERIFDIHQL